MAYHLGDGVSQPKEAEKITDCNLFSMGQNGKWGKWHQPHKGALQHRISIWELTVLSRKPLVPLYFGQLTISVSLGKLTRQLSDGYVGYCTLWEVVSHKRSRNGHDARVNWTPTPFTFTSFFHYILTIHRQIHASELMWPHKLLLEVTFKVYKNRWQVTVREVWDASCGDALQELCRRELHR
jgi:hypothetical protein